ncbi:hypothetical protein Tco_0459099, partial [Tanacetum coccineum]
MYDDVNVDLKDAEPADEGKGDEEITDAEKVNAEHEKGVNQEDTGSQVQDEAQATTTAAPTQVASSSRSVSSNYVQDENLSIRTLSLLTIHVSLIPKPLVLKPIPEIVTVAPVTNIPLPIPPFISHSQQSTPILTPTTTEDTTSTPAVPEFEILSAINLRVSDLEKEVQELKQVLQIHTAKLIKEHFVPADVVEVLKQQQKPQKSAADICKIKIEQAGKQQESKYTITSSDKAMLGSQKVSVTSIISLDSSYSNIWNLNRLVSPRPMESPRKPSPNRPCNGYLREGQKSKTKRQNRARERKDREKSKRQSQSQQNSKSQSQPRDEALE